MASKIIPKRSSLAGKVPTTADLDVGEIAVNLTDRVIYTKDAGGAVVQLGAGGITLAQFNALLDRVAALENIIANGTVKYSGKLTV